MHNILNIKHNKLSARNKKPRLISLVATQVQLKTGHLNSINMFAGMNRLCQPINVFFILLFVVCSCSSNHNQVENRNAEMGNVIKHYEQIGDKEKIRAAKYLAENMENKYSLGGNVLKDYFAIYDSVNNLYRSGIRDYKVLDSIAGRCIDSLKAYKGLRSGKDLERVDDFSVIKADSLIVSIDMAFDAWRTKPWASHVNFQQFCEYILPYRIYNEPLQYWRPYLKLKYDIFNDSLVDPKDPKEIVKKVNSYLYKEWKHLDSFNECSYLPGVIDVDRYHGGLCEHHYLLLTAVLRSLGVACAIDYTPQWRHWPDKHSWMVVLDTTGKMIAFNPGNPEFYFTHKAPLGLTGSATKVNRRSFTIHKNSLSNEKSENQVSLEISSPSVFDVTQEYAFEQAKIKIELKDIRNGTPVYLMAFNHGEQREFVAWSVLKNKIANFGSIGIPAVYIPVYFNNGMLADASKPFMVEDSSGTIKYIEPDIANRIRVRLYRKCVVGDSMNVYIDELLGAKFQVADFPDFSDAKDIYTISNRHEWMADVKVENQFPHRYIRLLTSPAGRINLAELEFYHDGIPQKITANNVFGSGNISKGSWNSIFDGDPGTSVSSAAGSWVAVDFGAKVEINRIKFLARNNLNIIVKGNIYELVYFDKGWHSLGRIIAKDDFVEFDNVPSGALLVLKNLSGGKEERIFTYNAGKQVFW